MTERRSFRYNVDPYADVWWGRGTQPDVLSFAVAGRLTRDPAFGRAIQTNTDLTLGANPMGKCWVTGLTPTSPREILLIDALLPDGRPYAGYVPFGPHRWMENADAGGPWAPGYAWRFTYPSADRWPRGELWFENRHCAATGEFTVTTQSNVLFALAMLRS